MNITCIYMVTTMAAQTLMRTPNGIDRRLIAEVVQNFYSRVRRDPDLGPIFNPRVEDWPEHEAKIRRFWCSVLLMSGEYHGSPMRVHLDIPDLRRDDFNRWLSLFAASLAEVCNAEQAAEFQSRAERIAEAFQFVRSAQSRDMPLSPPA